MYFLPQKSDKVNVYLGKGMIRAGAGNDTCRLQRLQCLYLVTPFAYIISRREYMFRFLFRFTPSFQLRASRVSRANRVSFTVRATLSRRVPFHRSHLSTSLFLPRLKRIRSLTVFPSRLRVPPTLEGMRTFAKFPKFRSFLLPYISHVRSR